MISPIDRIHAVLGLPASDSANQMLLLRDFSVYEGSRQIVHPLSVEFLSGVTAVMGLNGSGKTTLMRGLLGEASKTTGSIEWAGVSARRLRDVGWMPQGGSFPPRMTVREVLHYAAWLKDSRHPNSWIADSADAAGIGTLLERRAGHLSGGELRRLLFAVALLAGPPVLLLDEPTAALDVEQRDGLLQAIVAVSTERVVVMTTHILQDVSQVADRVLVLHEGGLRFFGTLQEFRSLGAGDDDTAVLTSAFRAVVAA